MAEARNYSFGYTEVAELLVKKLDIHEGLWGLYIEFNFGAANVNAGPVDKSLAPATIAAIKSIGIQRFDAPNNLTVDAAVVNPMAPAARRLNRPFFPLPHFNPKLRRRRHMSDRRTFLGNAAAAAVIAKISPLRSFGFTSDGPETIHPTMSDREKAGLRGSVKQCTEETITPAFKAVPR